MEHRFRETIKLFKRGNFIKNPFLCFKIILLVLFLGLVFKSGAFLNVETNNPLLASANTSFLSNSQPFAIPQEIEKESPDFNLIQKNSLLAVSPPIMVTPQVLGALAEAADFQDTQTEIVEYVIESGDSLGIIAEKFNISLETILWANDLNKNSKLIPGQKIVILPVSGLIHHVTKGDTLSGIAETYKGKTNEIASFNGISQENIYIGDILIIPGGIMPPKPSFVQYTPMASSYFICPVSSCRITQGLHWYNAIDFSNGKCGEVVYAAASGNVLKVKLTNSTWKGVFGGAGNNLTILHPNGVVTSYGHLLSAVVRAGDWVSQGQVIAFMGGQPGAPGAGRSTGCHLHFGVRGAQNPFSR